MKFGGGGWGVDGEREGRCYRELDTLSSLFLTKTSPFPVQGSNVVKAVFHNRAV